MGLDEGDGEGDMPIECACDSGSGSGCICSEWINKATTTPFITLSFWGFKSWLKEGSWEALVEWT